MAVLAVGVAAWLISNPADAPDAELSTGTLDAAPLTPSGAGTR